METIAALGVSFCRGGAGALARFTVPERTTDPDAVARLVDHVHEKTRSP